MEYVNNAFINDIINLLIQTALLFIGLGSLYISLKKENRKINEKVFARELANIERFNDLEQRVKLLEQKVDLYNDLIRKEFEDIKQILDILTQKFNDHLFSHNK